MATFPSALRWAPWLGVDGYGTIHTLVCDAGWSSPVARWAHNPKVAGSNPAPATNFPLYLLMLYVEADVCATLCATPPG